MAKRQTFSDLMSAAGGSYEKFFANEQKKSFNSPDQVATVKALDFETTYSEIGKETEKLKQLQEELKRQPTFSYGYYSMHDQVRMSGGRLRHLKTHLDSKIKNATGSSNAATPVIISELENKEKFASLQLVRADEIANNIKKESSSETSIIPIAAVLAVGGLLLLGVLK